ncbi:MAG: hypothetical protein ACOYOF_10275 [Verrucomicrobiaceae bacterium]
MESCGFDGKEKSGFLSRVSNRKGRQAYPEEVNAAFPELNAEDRQKLKGEANDMHNFMVQQFTSCARRWIQRNASRAQAMVSEDGEVVTYEIPWPEFSILKEFAWRNLPTLPSWLFDHWPVSEKRTLLRSGKIKTVIKPTRKALKHKSIWMLYVPNFEKDRRRH